MLVLMSYGLTGLAAMVVIAFCLACGDERSRAWKKYSFDLIDNAHLNSAQMIGTWMGALQLARTVCGQQETDPASLLQKTSPVETGAGAVYSDSFQNDYGPLEAFHG